ncbi:MAG: hypothetical protein AAFR17_13170 [Pseudomonadota bacterium]
MARVKIPCLATLALPLLAGACQTSHWPDQVAERESVMVSSLQPGSVTVDGPLGPVVMPRACLEPVTQGAAAWSPRSPAGCSLGLIFDRQVAAPRDLLVPRQPGLAQAQPVADAANAYLGTAPTGGFSEVVGSPADSTGGAEGAFTIE